MQQQSVEAFFNHYLQGNNLLTLHSNLQTKIKSSSSQPQQNYLIQIISYLTTTPPSTLHFKIITLLHPILTQIFSQLPKDVQQACRSGLLNAIIELHTDLKCIGGLGLLMRQLMQIDGAESWFEPFSQLLKWISSDDIKIMQAGIQFFIYIYKQTPYNQNNNDLPFYKIASPLLEVLFEIFANSQLTQPIRQKLLYLLLQIIRTFSIFDGSQDSIVRQCFDKTYQIWMSLFVSALQSSLHLHLTIKKYIMKILVVIFRDMPKYSEKSLAQYIPTIWQFIYKIIPLYLMTTVWNKPISISKTSTFYYDDDNQSISPPIETLLNNSLQFMSVLISIPQLSIIIRISIHHMINALFHCMLISRLQLLAWQLNPSHFMSHSGMIDSESGIRGKVLAMLNELIEKYNDLALQSILLICQKFLMNYKQAHTTQIIINFYQQINTNNINNQIINQNILGKYQTLTKLSSVNCAEALQVDGEDWRRVEVALIVLARFAEDIIVFQSKQQSVFDIESFVKGLIKQIQTEDYYPILKGQSLYCLMRFTEIISIKYKDLFVQLLVVSTTCLSDALPLSVRIVACKSLTTFSRKIEKQKLKIDGDNARRLLDNQPIENIITIEVGIETINPILQSLIQLIRLFTSLPQYPSTLNQSFSRITPEYMLLIYHKFNTHSNAMQLYFNLLSSVSNVQYIFNSIMSTFLLFIQQCLAAFLNILVANQKKYLRSSDIDLINQILKILNLLIVKSYQDKQQQAKIVNSNIVIMLCDVLEKNEQVSIHISLTICLKNALKFNKEYFDTNIYLDKITNTIRTLLKVPLDKTFESASLYSGNLTLLAHASIFPKINYQILQEVVLKVFKSRTPSVIQSLVLTYSTMINQHTNQSSPFQTHAWQKTVEEVVDFLASFSIENRMGLKILIDKWLLQQSLFRGKYTKISTFMALSKLFLLRDKRVDNLLVIGFNPSHTQVSNDVNAPLKILATLIRCLDNERGVRNNEDDDEDPMKEDNSGQLEVELEKFKEEVQGETGVGGLADRQNQQGSTCYMSAMLQFYDDGEECDETTQQDLLYLKDSSIHFDLGDYLLQFFNHLNNKHQEYFRGCLKGLLKQDVKTLKRFINIGFD